MTTTRDKRAELVRRYRDRPMAWLATHLGAEEKEIAKLCRDYGVQVADFNPTRLADRRKYGIA